MTTKDKTGDRLVASIRRTKAVAEDSSEESVPAEQAPQPSEISGNAGAQAKRDPASSAKDRAAKQTVGEQGNYQRGGRVWPD